MFRTAILTAALALGAAAEAAAARKIITYDPAVKPAVKAAVKWLGGRVVREFRFVDAVVAEMPDGVKDASLYSVEGVRSVSEDAYLRWLQAAPAAALPLQSVYAGLENFREGGAADGPAPAAGPSGEGEIPWGVGRVNAPAAWGSTDGRGVKVAVIDTGVDHTHPDLAPNYKGGWNAVTGSGDPMDDQGHGTHVAGTIAAARDGKGVAGVAPGADLYAVKVLDKNGSGNYSWIIAGIEWAIENRMDVVNMSLGGPSGTDALAQAVARAAEAGITVVCAAGNDSGPVNYPAKYPEALAVSASDSGDRIASFSSRGPEIDLIAPGVRINSAKMGGGYASLSGTSMASPHAAGLAALAAAAGAKGPEQVRAALAAAAAKLPGLTPEQQGAGLVDASRLLR